MNVTRITISYKEIVIISQNDSNMSGVTFSESVAAVPSGVDDAVGISGSKWYVAIVGNNRERSVAQKLEAMGFESFVASQEELRVWKNGRRKTVDRVLLAAIVFVRCTESERRRIIVNLPYINRFMTDRAARSDGSLNRHVAVVPDSQMDALRFMLGRSDDPVIFSDNYVKGRSVKVIRGNLRGLIGEIVDLADGQSELVIVINALGCAKVHINPIDVECI